MTTDRDRILSDFMDAWNAGTRPDADDYLQRVPPAEQPELTEQLLTFMASAPTPAYDEATLAQIRSEPMVAGALSQEGAGLLKRVRERLGLSIDQVAAQLAGELGLDKQRRAKTATYLDRWEQGELASARVSRRVFDGLASVLGVPRDELEGAADLGGPAAVPVFRAQSEAAAAAGPYLDVLVEALEMPAEADYDEVDELFTGGR